MTAYFWLKMMVNNRMGPFEIPSLQGFFRMRWNSGLGARAVHGLGLVVQGSGAWRSKFSPIAEKQNHRFFIGDKFGKKGTSMMNQLDNFNRIQYS